MALTLIFALTGVGLFAFLMAFSFRDAGDLNETMSNIRVAVAMTVLETAAFFAINSQL